MNDLSRRDDVVTVFLLFGAVKQIGGDEDDADDGEPIDEQLLELGVSGLDGPELIGTVGVPKLLYG